MVIYILSLVCTRVHKPHPQNNHKASIFYNRVSGPCPFMQSPFVAKRAGGVHDQNICFYRCHHLTPTIFPLSLGKVQTLYFIRCSHKGLLSYNLSKQLVVIYNMTTTRIPSFIIFFTVCEHSVTMNPIHGKFTNVSDRFLLWPKLCLMVFLTTQTYSLPDLNRSPTICLFCV